MSWNLKPGVGVGVGVSWALVSLLCGQPWESWSPHLCLPIPIFTPLGTSPHTPFLSLPMVQKYLCKNGGRCRTGLPAVESLQTNMDEKTLCPHCEDPQERSAGQGRIYVPPIPFLHSTRFLVTRGMSGETGGTGHPMLGVV